MLEPANMIILIILIIVLLLIPFLINKTLKKKDIKLDNENKINENIINKKGFSMYVENDNGEYEGYNSSNIFPIGYILNTNKSKCVDNNGLEVKDILSENGNKLTITSNKTVFCYIYFDKDTSLAGYLMRNVSSDELWDSPLEGDGYRFVGTNPNNYICFGTTDKNTCINDTDKYMYRIIGIFEDDFGNKHTKLIKKEALNTKYQWNSDYQTDTDWNKSDLYKGINGSYFLENTSYSYMQDSTWTNKIATWNYTMTNTKSYENYTNNSVYGSYYYYETGKTMYLHELNRNSKVNESCHYSNSTSVDCNVGEWKTLSTKISLMYASDYALSLGSDALDYISYNNVDILKTGWIYLVNNDISAPDTAEWTMSRRGKESTGYYSAWRVFSGLVGYNSVDGSDSARPVFYLESDVEFSSGSGDGSITNPYLLK